MRLLLTSDTQTDRTNIDLCEIALQELLTAANKYHPDAVIHAGDLKDQYDPVNIEVVKFWVRATKQIIGAGYRFIILKGNHDRISQSIDSKNWLDILRAAGAETVSTPRTKKIGDGAVAFLPYTGDKKQERKWLQQLSSTVLKAPSVLVFHAEVTGALLNASGALAKGLQPGELLSTFDLCLGGHLHMYQRVANGLFYIGSPFCHDWNEADQAKGHVFVDIGNGTYTIKQIKTKIPGWYNQEYLAKHKLVPEAGAYIRSKVLVTSKKITDQIRKEEQRLAEKYGKSARLYVVPVLDNPEEVDIAIKGTTDKEKVTQYVAVTIPDEARFKASQVINYLTSKLTTVAPDKAGGILKFISMEAENVLSYKQVKFRYSKQGLVLVRGVHQDWPKRSNGAGKTNLLSLLLVALFGESFKEQKADAWANEHTEGHSYCKLVLKDGAGRLIEIERHRPHSLVLRINGNDQSSGLTGKPKKETQGLIEEVTGYDKRTLLNAVYIDQSIANGFVFGTNKTRMDLISKLQNLERFEEALKLVSKDIQLNEQEVSNTANSTERFEEDISRLEEELKELETQVETSWKEKLKVATTEVKRLIKVKASLKATEEFYKQKREEADTLLHDWQEAVDHATKSASVVGTIQQQINLAKVLIKQGKCDRCGQPSVDAGKNIEATSTKILKTAIAKREREERYADGLENQQKKLEAELTKYGKELDKADSDLENAREVLAEIETAAKEEAERNKKIESRKQVIDNKLRQAKRFLQASQSRQHELAIDREMLEYSKKAFSRTGLPLYLSAALCPVLNAAAEEYSDIFYDGKIKVHFSVKDGEFPVEVINTAGSQTTEGQSVGESAMAGVITAFSLREAAPKTNLLILDEPGHGLDQQGCIQFAKGLLKLKDRFGTILVTTHSAYIDSVLSGETVWTVTKKNKISYLEQ